MPKEEVYLLTFNSEVLFASKNITVLWMSLYRRCEHDRLETPIPYATVRRRIIEKGFYIHEPRKGWEYRILIRTLIRKPVQRQIGLFQDAMPKQS